ncbi:lysozyme protein [Anaeramoeba flamelloides]|uniref:Lysozyme protein n=1 Tax=Anaeramoeba flamelloides TaxID=1746091 RepID=A0AAV8A3V1_9EUKA|nr:lysozyme protein [Anaeramoeba flamelloides]
MRTLFVCFLLTFLSCLHFSKCYDLSFDIPYNSKPLDSDFACLAEQGYSSGVVEGLKSNGNCAFDAKYKLDLCNGHQSRCDLAFDLDREKDPVTQINDAIDCLKKINVQNSDFNKIWAIVELGRQPSGEWPISNSSDQSSNVDFISKVLMAISYSLEVDRIGIETSKTDWSQITGDSTIGIEFGLYYHGDNQENFEDFVPFGGWTFDQVEMKKYSTNQEICKATFDLGLIQ